MVLGLPLLMVDDQVSSMTAMVTLGQCSILWLTNLV